MILLRAAAHVHSDWSYDGKWPLERLAVGFARRGYNLVLMAEHDTGFDDDRWERYRRACEHASSSRVTLIPGMEYGDEESRVHVVVWGEARFLGERRSTVDVLREAAESGAVSVLAHPGRRSALEAIEPDAFELLTGIELWNRKYDGWAPGEAARRLLARYPELAPFVGLDFHTRRQFFQLAMSIDAEARTEEAIVEALRAGRAEGTVLGMPVHYAVRPRVHTALGRLESGRRPAARAVRQLVPARRSASRTAEVWTKRRSSDRENRI